MKLAEHRFALNLFPWEMKTANFFVTPIIQDFLTDHSY